MAFRRVLKEDLITPPCVAACPAGVDAARYIRCVKAGRFDEAVAVIREKIPFPTVCADACFAPCEEACAYRQIGDAVAIRALKKAAVDNAENTFKASGKLADQTGKTVGVMGAGPAGLTAAYYLSILGHKVTVYDGFSEPGGTMRYGIPSFRLPKERITKDIDAILAPGITFKGNTIIGKDMSFEEMRSRFDAVFIACGSVGSTKVPIEGAEKNGVLLGWDFLKDVSLGKTFDLKGEVLVLGGGNVAIDAARTAKRLGNGNVTIVYRRTRGEMPAHPSEIEAAELEGIMIIDSWAPKRIMGDQAVTGMAFVKCFSSDDASCNYEPVYDEEITHKLSADHVILAIGQSPYLKFLSREENIETGSDRILVKETDLSTGEKGVFAGGDVVSGPDSIISAIAHGRKAAEAIDRYLGGSGDITEILAPPEKAVELSDLPLTASPREEPSSLKPWQRISSFDPVEQGFSRDQITAESERCLLCDARQFEVVVNPEHCKECGYCAEVCDMETFQPSETFNVKGYRPMECKSSDWCVGCMKCYFACPDFAIDIKEVTG
jgi:NADPH-dependent glutamate synthase beta subunit-like oxidoreductase/NAD-dependent dihydropyrimidine dehydrogenase PreA subunit